MVPSILKNCSEDLKFEFQMVRTLLQWSSNLTRNRFETVIILCHIWRFNEIKIGSFSSTEECRVQQELSIINIRQTNRIINLVLLFQTIDILKKTKI